MIEATLVSASTWVMKPLLSKLTKLLGHEYVKLKGMHKQIRFLGEELSAMSATLQVLEDAEELDPQAKDWRDKLRELAYDTEDCIDAFMARVDLGHDAPAGFAGLFRKLKKLKAPRGIADEIKDLKTRAMVVGDRHKRYYSFVDPVSNYSTSAIDPRLPALYEEFNNLVGINGQIDHIIEWLVMDPLEFKVLSIAGCGGLGKTTLANQVYHTIKSKFFSERQSQFLCTAFVSVSQNPNLTKLLRDVAEEIGITDYRPNDDERQLINKLRTHLQDKRYFIIVDDVWDAQVWEAIRLALFDNRRGSRIIMTTRNLAVASCCSSDGKAYQMEALSFADSKTLFCRRVFGSEELCYPHLAEVCDSIVEKCGGLPLAIITIASLLADQLAIEEWNRVLTVIGHALAKDPGAWKMTKILCLSYFDLTHQLRSCWLYLSIFPEDHEINKQHLISRWIAEGFIYEKDEHSQCEVGERYFNDLINRSLIQAIDVQYGQARACRIHDIILDFITCKAAEENFVTSLYDAQHEHISDRRIRRICIDNRNEDVVTTWSGLVLSHIRSLTVFGHSMEPPFLGFTALRVLDLADCWGMQDHHLGNIGNLYHLKYLNLGSDLITTLPDKIGKLQYLETLDIQGTSIVELPSTITKLQRLSRLYIDPHTRFPDGTIGKMNSLEELKEFGVCSYKVGKTLQEFCELTNLRRLSVSWRFDWPDDFEGSQAEDLYSSLGTLVSSCSLHHLNIVRSRYAFPFFESLDSWCPVAPSSLRKLHISFFIIYEAPNWMKSLENLKELELDIFFMRPEDVEILGAIPCLVFLELNTYKGTDGRLVVPGNNRFRNLKYFSLVIAICGTALEFEAGSMPKVEHLKFRFCVHKMDCLNGASNLGVQHLSTLTKVEVDMTGNCNYNDNYKPWADRDEDDGSVKYVASTIKSAVETLPSRPTIRFKTIPDHDCAFQQHTGW
ncbi:unnamed protein product [Urochloa decumbens]|uniref:Uncharacterized protein n=1 Tax=Urochloa decumbens TaxID=240449 RepID=A0ABC9BMT1_9POAL